MNTLKRIATVATSMCMAAGAFVAAAPQASATIPSMGLQVGSTMGPCLGQDYLPGEDSSSVIVWKCNGNPDQRWSADVVSFNLHDGLPDTVHLVNDNNQCLGVWGGDIHRGANASAWDCNGNPDQQWNVEPVGGGMVRLHSTYHQELCLGLRNGGTWNGNYAIVWDCNNNSDQKFVGTNFGI
ncbi:RICIN domain-containing protein [Streptomyces noboritoensis]|uniref:RICIN domain-containing protein n=1 Tax=Streptomyces noboritoensis TaxID=67337 RepID=A0ABV6TC66_9ACTN